MDRMIYTAMTGLNAVMSRQDAGTHNLANATTPGYKAAAELFRAVPVVSSASPTRAFVVHATSGADLREGGVQETGRPLDVAVAGEGWIALTLPNGSEAYTRNGALQIGADGTLQSSTGIPVAGDAGPIVIPPGAQISIGRDGLVSVNVAGSGAGTPNPVGTIKLVRSENGRMVRGDDGLFRPPAGVQTNTDPTLTLTAGALEQSNVNVIGQMVDMIALSKSFEIQSKLIQTAEANDKAAQQLIAH